MEQRQRRILAASLALLILGLVSPGLAGPSGWAVAQESQLVAGGSAFGSQVTVEGLITSDKSAPVGLGCSSTGPAFKENAIAGLDQPPLFGIGAVNSSVERIETTALTRVTAVSEIADVELLGGLITASALKAVSVTRKDAAGFGTHAAGTQFVDLNVLGIPLDLNPPPNTEIPLPLLGFVRINERSSAVLANRANHRTIMLHVSVTLPNVLGIPVGTEIIVGSAASRISQQVAILGGGANGGSVKVGDLALLSGLFPQGMPCSGTGGEIRSNSGLGLGLPGVLSSGTIVNEVQGNSTPTTVNATSTSSLEGLNLLLGLVSAETIVARAHIEGDPGDLTMVAWGSKFIDLQIAGFPEITDNVPTNTQIDILGLGELWIKRVVRSGGRRIQTRALELSVLENNQFGLPIGASIKVGVATALAR